MIQLAAEHYGSVRSLNYDQAKVGMGMGTGAGEIDRGWNAWVARVKKDMQDMR